MKKTFIIFIKVIISFGLLGFLFYRFPISIEQWNDEWQNLQWQWMVLTLLTGMTAYLIGLLRWHLLLKAHGFQLPFRQVVVIGWIGLFFSSFSIGILGGDVARIFYLLKLYPHQKSKALASIVLDRTLGFLGLCLIAILVLPFSWSWLAGTAETLLISFAVILGVSFLGLISLLFLRRRKIGLFYLLGQTAWGQKLLTPVDQILAACVQQKKTILGACLSLSAGVHFSLILCGYCLVRVFALPISFFLMACLMPLINMAIALPITISGLGVRESLILVLFQNSHLPESKSLLFSLAYWMVGLVISAVGGVFYIFYRCSEPLNNGKISAS